MPARVDCRYGTLMAAVVNFKNGNGQMSDRGDSPSDQGQPATYEIRVKGELDQSWGDWFPGLVITPQENGDTLLSGPVVDQAALHGLLRRVRDLGVPLVSVNRIGPSSHRKTAVVVGLLFIICTAMSVLQSVATAGLLDGAQYLTGLSAHGGRMVAGALIEFAWAFAAAGIAVALYPVLRKHSRALALGSVACRLIEGALILVGTLALLALLSIGKQTAAGGSVGASSFQAVATVLLATRDWIHGFVMLLAWLSGAFMYYYLLYVSRLVPRWLSGWGLVAALLCLAATVYSGFTQEFGFTTVNTALNIPIGIQEMVLAVWLIAKGFAPAQTRSRHV